jgi:hypothetical protein
MTTPKFALRCRGIYRYGDSPKDDELKQVLTLLRGGQKKYNTSSNCRINGIFA